LQFLDLDIEAVDVASAKASSPEMYIHYCPLGVALVAIKRIATEIIKHPKTTAVD
jgi:hypothetical protein